MASKMHPKIIQGGMGIAVSQWKLAKAVSQIGHLGVVSGTGLDNVVTRRLQDGDLDGSIRRALEHFPVAEWAQSMLKTYFRPEGRQGQPYRRVPLHKGLGHFPTQMLTVLSAFVEVFLAKEGHLGKIGINLLTKIQTHTLPSLYGAVLAGVDYVLMGAGIPRQIPEVLDQFAQGERASLKLDVAGANPDAPFHLEFDPSAIGMHLTRKRPDFLPIVSSNALATMLARKSPGSIAGFIVEGPTAGGHNAPPRGRLTLDDRGEPIYGEKDTVDLEQLKTLGLPFWLAGSMGSPEALRHALSQGAEGIQVGTLFAYTQESGFSPELKSEVLAQVQEGSAHVKTDVRASPTGFPFKVVGIPGTLSSEDVYLERKRVCDIGYLREACITPAGKLDFRCPAEPTDTYIAKGGAPEDAVGRKCLCNALMSSVGLGQIQRSGVEPSLVTSGDDLVEMGPFLNRYGTHYSAKDVIDYLEG